jgi:hypothetical protein
MMDRATGGRLSRTARRRIFTYLNCNQCTLSTQRDHLGTIHPMLLKANSHLEGGCFSRGSTCGVVSGGCQSLALRHLEELRRGEPARLAAFHSLLKEYTGWFAANFGSTLCRERCGCRFDTPGGIAGYALGGRFLRCVVHAGRAARFLAELEERPLGEEDPGEAGSGGEVFHCSLGVLRRLREATGAGDEDFDALYISMNGGVGLSGGLCGAAAAGMLPIGWHFGLDPEELGFRGNLAGFVRGHLDIIKGRERRDLFSLGNRFIKGWLEEFGSLECRDLTGTRFTGFGDFSSYAKESPVCRRAVDFAVEKSLELLS